jgi:crotonobetainyl-CoA:carnitine CoA-transferase CaiB-like acyl-CoA transferase
MHGALENITVIDLSRVLAGPWASQMLADFGATVIKVERPYTGDDTRFWGPPFIKNKTSQQPPQSAYYHCTNRNKKSIAIDIDKPKGQEIIVQLIKKADVVIENFKVGGLVKYGLDYESIKKINSNIVYCSITGFGQKGPSSHRAGYDAMIQGEGGLMSLTGESEGDPMKVGVALVDVMAGLYSCNAILASLMARDKIKKGQYIDISLLDVQAATLANQGMNYLATKNNPKRHGNSHPNIVPYQTFKTLDGRIILAIGNDTQFSKFCELADCTHLSIDPKYSSNENRVKNRDNLIPKLKEILELNTTIWWIAALDKIGVPCGPVNKLSQVFDHPQIKHRKIVKQVPDVDGKPVDTIASPINLSETPLQYNSASPELSQHCEEILKSGLGYSDDEILILKQSKIVS